LLLPLALAQFNGDWISSGTTDLGGAAQLDARLMGPLALRKGRGDEEMHEEGAGQGNEVFHG